MPKIQFSNQAQILIDNLKDFDIEDFTKWYEKQLAVVGSKPIHMYLAQKEDGTRK